MSTPARTIGIVLFAVAAGCGHVGALKPAVAAQAVPGQKDTAAAEAAGVRVIVYGAWDGTPSDLGDLVTPVRVTVENHSGAPLRVHYEQFQLTSASGLQANAMPPFSIQRPGSVTPYYPYTGFFIAPMFSPWYPGLAPWSGPFNYDPFYYENYYRWQQPLPSRDMLVKALPVGVLDDNGQVTGYLYFQKVAKDTPQVTFSYDLVDAKSGNALGKIGIPLVPAG